MRAVSCDQVEAFGLLVLKQRRDRFPAVCWTFQSGVGPAEMLPQPTTGRSPHASNLTACRANFSTQAYRGVSIGPRDLDSLALDDFFSKIGEQRLLAMDLAWVSFSVQRKGSEQAC